MSQNLRDAPCSPFFFGSKIKHVPMEYLLIAVQPGDRVKYHERNDRQPREVFLHFARRSTNTNPLKTNAGSANRALNDIQTFEQYSSRTTVSAFVKFCILVGCDRPNKLKSKRFV